MTTNIAAHFDHLEQRLLESDAISKYTIVKREITPMGGKVRIRAQLKDGGLLELFEYVALDASRQPTRLKYSYHWQGATGVLVRRCAVPHHPNLPYAPHHVHLPDGSVEGVANPPDATEVLNRIETRFGQRQEK